MKNLILWAIPALFLFTSCEQDDVFPRIEDTTHGEKWTLQIGSSPTEVYNQLQELGTEKEFDNVAIVYREPYSNPEDIQNIFGFYRSVTLETTSGVTERALIEFDQDKVNSIETGGAMLDAVSAWPKDKPDEMAIHVDDPIDTMYEKLLAICQVSPYSDYQIILPDKSLDKPFDPDMANYDEWAFSFTEDVSSNIVGKSSVRLYFSNQKLVRIRNEYSENEVVY
ncbi:hypothetical protein [Prolixibacter sp. NT017]|uniref:hypothetical protein n=1 Tax=Prolixibacter sp. NT017 TaxID=2652390 RepID=UPI00127A0642|nr:hypothetical protein [Prolixibacter sp. NT017]GET25073.1 hypothetical protein NT017_14020 [Prolixibacter sp. NT017]